MLCFRGTSVYMAPEILIKSSRLDAASFENLKKVDVWAFGMVMFNLVNPNLKYPFQLDLEKESPLLDQLPDFLQQQNYPSESPKYAHQREAIWASIVALKKKCTSLDPASRPSASKISDEFIEILVGMVSLVLQTHWESEEEVSYYNGDLQGPVACIKLLITLLITVL